MKTLQFLFISACLFGFLQVQGQHSGFDKKKLSLGGNLQLSFSSYSTVIGGSPIISYNFTDRLIGGVGITYTYYQWKEPNGFTYKDQMWGGHVFGQFMLTESLFLASEFHSLNMKVPDYDPISEQVQEKRSFVHLFYVGGGYRSRIGGNSFVFASVLYDLIQDPYSPYSNPYVRVGFMIGL